MTREQLEAQIWAITGRDLTGSAVDAIVDAAEQYASERVIHAQRPVIRHTSGTDLYPLIGLLASLLEDAGAEPDAEAPGERHLRAVS